MIFLDANVLLRYVVPAETDSQLLMQNISETVLSELESGSIEATTSEVVLHEFCYVLTSKRHYGIGVNETIDALEPILRLQSVRFPPGDRDVYLRALAIWKQNPKLEFSDSVIAARCEAHGWELATFDETLAAVPTVTRWQPDTA